MFAANESWLKIVIMDSKRAARALLASEGRRILDVNGWRGKNRLANGRVDTQNLKFN